MLFFEAFAACGNRDIWQIFPVETEVRDVSFATRVDSGPVRDGNVVIYSRSWRGGAGGTYRNVNIRLYIYPDAESARKRVEEYGRSLGSRAERLKVGDVGFSPKQKYTLRSYYLVAKNCCVVEFFSSYANAGLVGDDTGVLSAMVARIAATPCLCGDECTATLSLSPERPRVGQRVTVDLETSIPDVQKVVWRVTDGVGRIVNYKGSGGRIEFIQPPGCITVLAAVYSRSCGIEAASWSYMDLGRRDNPPKISVVQVKYTPKGHVVSGSFRVSDPDGDRFVVDAVDVYPGPLDRVEIWNLKWDVSIPVVGKNGVYTFRASLPPEFISEMKEHFAKLGDNRITLVLRVRSVTCRGATKNVFVPTGGSFSGGNVPNGNAPPIVRVICTTPFENRIVGKRICFSAVVSDPDGDPLAVRWFLNGAGMGGLGPTVCKLFNAPGTYTVTAAVSDGLVQRTASYVLVVSKNKPLRPPAKKRSKRKKFEYGIDRPGMDYTHFTLSKPDPSLCQAKCYEQPRCKAWTYVKPNTIQGPWPVCWLKSGVPKAVPNPNTVSGVKKVDRFRGEAWLSKWRVVANASGKIPNSNQPFGWKGKAVRIGDAMPPSGAHGGALYLHPLSRNKPAHLKGQVFVKSPFHKLVMRVAGNTNGDWFLEIRVNGRRAFTKVVDGRRWYTVAVPLGAYRGRVVDVDILAWANGWSYEYAFIDEILDTY